MKVTDLEILILEKAKEIKKLLEENNMLEYFTLYISKQQIDFNNEYWDKETRREKIQLTCFKDNIVKAGGEWK